jgi:hypothetical protein
VLKRCFHFTCGKAEQILSFIFHFSASKNNAIDNSRFGPNAASLSGAKKIPIQFLFGQ